jgi:hypothetical protein
LTAKVATLTTGLDWQESVKDKDLNNPPGGAVFGDRYIVAAIAGGLWAGHEDDIAEYDGANWVFYTPDEGTAVWVEDENTVYAYDGANWILLGGGGGDNLGNHQATMNLDMKTFDIVNVGNISMTKELDMTGTDVIIDLNPSGTGSKNIIDITPTAALIAGSVWKGINMNVGALDPAAGAASALSGFQLDCSGFLSANGNASIYGFYFTAPAGDASYGFIHDVTEMTADKTQIGFYTHGNLTLSNSYTYTGFWTDYSGMARDANAPILQGVRVNMPADYSNWGANYAGYFAGDARSVLICDTTYALDVSGAMRLDGVITGVNSITLDLGATIDEFSIDGTLAGNSDTALPTEKAVKTYVGAAPVPAHTHDGDTLQLDGVNSNGGAFSFSTTGAITFNQQLILTHAVAGALDINPANTGSQNVIDITPTAQLVDGSTWKGIYMATNALGPNAGAGTSTIIGGNISFTGYASADHDSTLEGFVVGGGAKEVQYDFCSLPVAKTEAKEYDGYYNYTIMALGQTQANRGAYIAWSGVTRTANAPILEGIRVELPAVYTNFGTCYAGYFSGAGRTVDICDVTNALYTTDGTRTVALSDGTNSIAVNAEIDMTGTGAQIDLNPAHVGGGAATVSIIDITPTHTIADVTTWNGLYVVTGALDPTAGAGITTIIGADINLVNTDSADSDAVLKGVLVQGSATDLQYDFQSLPIAKTDALTYIGYYNYSTMACGITQTNRGAHIAWSGVTRSANAPILEGVRVELPAAYTNFGQCYAGYFSGGGDIIGLCDGTRAIDIAPSLTATQDVIRITPSAAMAAATVWTGLRMTTGALDPLAGGVTTIQGIDLNLAGTASANGNATLKGFVVDGSATDLQFDFESLPIAKTNATNYVSFETYLPVALGQTQTNYGLRVEWSAATRSANAPVLIGVSSELPAVYTNFGANKAGYFTGGGATVTLCDGTYGLNVSTGDGYVAGKLTTGGNIQINGNNILSSTGGTCMTLSSSDTKILNLQSNASAYRESHFPGQIGFSGTGTVGTDGSCAYAASTQAYFEIPIPYLELNGQAKLETIYIYCNDTSVNDYVTNTYIDRIINITGAVTNITTDATDWKGAPGNFTITEAPNYTCTTQETYRLHLDIVRATATLTVRAIEFIWSVS